jgi:hypothetical protein
MRAFLKFWLPAGDMNLGGEDFDNGAMDYLIKNYKKTSWQKSSRPVGQVLNGANVKGEDVEAASYPFILMFSCLCFAKIILANGLTALKGTLMTDVDGGEPPKMAKE